MKIYLIFFVVINQNEVMSLQITKNPKWSDIQNFHNMASHNRKKLDYKPEQILGSNLLGGVVGRIFS
jgi:hypothetical protein